MVENKNQIRKDFEDFITEFKNESDRAIVILIATKIDYLLLCILQKYLLPSTSNDDEFFENQGGPGSSFSNKIMLAYRLGLIDKDMTRALHIIRKLRNDFAHEITGCSLDKGSHRDRVHSLATPYRKFPFYKMFREAYFENIPHYRAEYMTVAGLLIIRLSYLLEHIEPISDDKAWRVLSKRLQDWKLEPEKLSTTK